MVSKHLHGWPIEAIDDVAYELMQTLSEMDQPSDLSILALCRAITMLGTDGDLDLACKWIDDLAEVEVAQSLQGWRDKE